MRLVLETSTLVAAVLPGHVHHAAALPWLEFAKTRATFYGVAAHTTSECYSVLTRMPRNPKILPREALGLLEKNVFGHAEIFTLDAAEYAEVIRRLVANSLPGAIIHDAVIARTAELAGVDRLVTLNAKHFLKVWNGDPAQIVSPLDAAPPTAP